MPPSASPVDRKASQACRACRRLKRKCTKELPACSLVSLTFAPPPLLGDRTPVLQRFPHSDEPQCVRLGKPCNYFDTPVPESSLSPNIIGRLRHLEQLLDVDRSDIASDTTTHNANDISSLVSASDEPFPSSYFLDPDFHRLLGPDVLSTGRQPFMERAFALLGSDPEAVYHRYTSTVHTWLPMLSRKRLVNEIRYPKPDTAARHTLLLLCMKLCSEVPAAPSQQPSQAPLYSFVESASAASEIQGFISLRLVQSLMLLAAYELGHAIYPSAYLTLGRAARLSSMMGMHNRRHSQQLFTDADTWTLREEQRRTWWAMFVLDRMMNCETVGLPFAAPDPCSDDLLPMSDTEWDDGLLGSNEPLFTTALHMAGNLGPFARLCQTAHMLGKVIAHRDRTKNSAQDALLLLSEAMQLHRTLVVLELSLEPPGGPAPSSSGSPSAADERSLSALAVCCSARFLLYGLYACNEPGGSVSRERVALETEMQRTSLEGIKALASRTVPGISHGLKQMAASAVGDSAGACLSPLVYPCLYHAATECAWFFREDHERSMYQALGEIIRGMELLGEFWGAGEHYMALLEQGNVIKIMSDVDIATSDRGSMASDAGEESAHEIDNHVPERANRLRISIAI